MRLPDETQQLLRWVQGGLLAESQHPPEIEPGEAPSSDSEGRGSDGEIGFETAADEDAGAPNAEEAIGETSETTEEVTPDDESDSPADDATTETSGDALSDVDVDSGLDELLEQEPDIEGGRPDDDLDLADAIDELSPRESGDDRDGRRGHGEDLPFDDTAADRDERIDEYHGTHGHDTIRQRLRESGVAERIQTELADLFRGSRTQVKPRRNLGRPDTDVVGGRPEMRQVVRRFAGDLRVRDVFERPSPGQDDDVAVGVVLDLSSSMRGDAEGDAKAAAGAFLFAIEQFGGDTIAVSYPRVKRTTLITGARERFQWKHLDAGRVGGGTPTSTAVADGADLLAECSADRYLLIVLTDGGARDPSATRAIVDEVRDRGRDWAVVGFGYGGIQEGKLETQFGDDGYRAVDIEELPTELVDVYRDQHPRL